MLHQPMPWMEPFAKRADQDERARLEELAEQLAEDIQRAFLAAVDTLGNRIDLKRLTALLEDGRAQEAVAIVTAALAAGGFTPVAASVTDAIIAAGKRAASVISRTVSGAQFVFSLVRPRTAQVMQTNENDTLRDLTNSAVETVRQIINTGVLEGRDPRDVARDVRRHVGLTPRQAQAVVNYRRTLEADEKTPRPKDKIDALVEEYRVRSLRARALTISRTEATRAVNQGNMLSWEQAVEDGRVNPDNVVRQWVYTHDLRTRHAHRLIPSMNKQGVGLREPFKSPLGPIMYPGDPAATAANVINCRCSMIIRAK